MCLFPLIYFFQLHADVGVVEVSGSPVGGEVEVVCSPMEFTGGEGWAPSCLGCEGPIFPPVPFVAACAKRACSCIILKFSAWCIPLGQHSLQRVAELACALFVVVFGFMFQSLVQPTLARILCCFYLLNRLIALRSRQKEPGGPLWSGSAPAYNRLLGAINLSWPLPVAGGGLGDSPWEAWWNSQQGSWDTRAMDSCFRFKTKFRSLQVPFIMLPTLGGWWFHGIGEVVGQGKEWFAQVIANIVGGDRCGGAWQWLLWLEAPPLYHRKQFLTVLRHWDITHKGTSRSS